MYFFHTYLLFVCVLGNLSVEIREQLGRVGSPSSTWVPRIELGINALKLLFKSRVFMKLRLTLNSDPHTSRIITASISVPQLPYVLPEPRMKPRVSYVPGKRSTNELISKPKKMSCAS